MVVVWEACNVEVVSPGTISWGPGVPGAQRGVCVWCVCVISLCVWLYVNLLCVLLCVNPLCVI